MDAFQLLGYVGAVFNIATYSMRTMIPLRSMAIASNLIFIAYGALADVWPILILHAILLPLNALRLREMVVLVRRIRNAAQGDLKMDWVKPFMTKRSCTTGQVLFAKGESASEMFLVLSGSFLLKELRMELTAGAVVGELGLLAAENRRSQTLQCIAAGEVLTITYDQVRQLYFQNPKFGFFFLRLTTQRLFENIQQLEAELENARGSSAAQPPWAADRSIAAGRTAGS